MPLLLFWRQGINYVILYIRISYESRDTYTRVKLIEIHFVPCGYVGAIFIIDSSTLRKENY